MGVHFRQRDQLGPVLPGQTLSPRPGLQLGKVRGQQRDGKFAPVAQHDRVGDELVAPQQPFDRLRRHFLPAGGHDQVLLTIGDLEEAVGVQLPDVTGVEPAVRIDRLAGRLRLVEVPLHDVRAAHQDLPIRGDLDLDPGDGPAHGAEAERVERVGSHDR